MFMKRILVVAIMTVACLTMMAQGRCFAYVDDEDGYVNVRKGMSTSSAVMQQLHMGTNVYVTPTGTKWYHVSLSSTGPYIGYVYYNRVALYDCIESKYQCEYQFKVTDPDGFTNVRQLATTKSKIVKRLNRGAYFTGKYAVDANGWIGVIENGLLIGFVHHTKVKQISVLLS